MIEESAMTLLIALLMATAKGAGENIGKFATGQLLIGDTGRKYIEEWEYLQIVFKNNYEYATYGGYWKNTIEVFCEEDYLYEKRYDNNIIEVLNECGKDGWELVTNTETDITNRYNSDGTKRECTTTSTYTLKREKNITNGNEYKLKNYTNEYSETTFHYSEYDEYNDGDCSAATAG